jgi:cell wall assembly regulator SMI1
MPREERARPSAPALCAALDAARRSSGALQQLGKGATQVQLSAFVQRLGLSPPGEFREFYRHFNGSGEQEICGFYHQLSLSQILKAKRLMDKMEAEGFFADWQPGSWWNPGWLPFLEFNGNYLCIDLAGSVIQPAGQIIEFLTHDARRTVLHRSFYDWLHTLSALAEAGPSDAEAWLEFQESRAAGRLRRQLNPGYPIQRTARAAKRRLPKSRLQLERWCFERGPRRWVIDRAGAVVRISYGMSYSVRQVTKRCTDADKAQAFVEREIAAKTRAGYVRTAKVRYSDDDAFLREAARLQS